MKLNPLEERIVVKLVDDIKTKLHLPEKLKERSLIGLVLEIGPNCTLLKIGDKILFARYSGFLLPLREFSETKIMNESDVLAIITEENK